jgi:hypothetical protein
MKTIIVLLASTLFCITKPACAQVCLTDSLTLVEFYDSCGGEFWQYN